MKVTSVEDMKAGITFVRFTPIDDMPLYKAITRLETKMIEDVTTIGCCVPHPRSNLRGAIEQPVDYNLWVGTHFLTTPYPGDMPNFLDNCTTEPKKQFKTTAI